MAGTSDLRPARRKARATAESVFRRPQLVDLVLAFEDRAARLYGEAMRQVTQVDSDASSAAQAAVDDYMLARQIAEAIREGELSGRDLEDAIVEFSNIMFDNRKGRERWDVPAEIRPFTDDELRAINNAARAEGLMGEHPPSARYYKEARVAGGFGSAIAYRLDFLKQQIDAGVKIDSIVLLASSEAPPNDKTGFWLKDFVGDNYPDDAAMRARAQEVDSNWTIKSQFDVALASAYVILGEKFAYPAHNVLQQPGGAYVIKKSPSVGGAELMVVAAFPSHGPRVSYSDQNATLAQIAYDKAKTGDTLLHVGTSVYPWFEEMMLREHTIKDGLKTESVGYNKVTPRLAVRQPPAARALWENYGDCEAFISAWHAAELAGDTKRANGFKPIAGEYLQETASLIRETHELNLDLDRFEREQQAEHFAEL